MFFRTVFPNYKFYRFTVIILYYYVVLLHPPNTNLSKVSTSTSGISGRACTNGVALN